MSEYRQIICPACGSKLSADGKVLERSVRLCELDKIPARVSEMEQRVETLQRKFRGSVKE